MNKDSWQRSAVVYQIYPRSFLDTNGDGVGDLNGITRKMDYLKTLGVDILWLNPIFDSPNDDNGYDIRDYRRIMKEFGTMEDFENLLQTAHQHGIRIMLDLVVNHSSDEHLWFQKSKAREAGYEDYYIWKPGKNGGPPNNWGAAFGGSAWEYVPERNEYYLHCFSKKQPDLNWENPKVRDEVYDLMTFWCKKGIDGFRMDVINMISKDPNYPDGEKGNWIYGDNSPYTQNGPHVHEYLKEMNERVLSKYDLMTVGEMPGITTEDAKKYTAESRKELQMAFQFEHMGIDNGPRGEITHKKVSLPQLKKVLSQWEEDLQEEGWNSLYWNNHDQPRCVSRFGNDREYRVRSAKCLGACLHLMKGTPYIYMGEELGMTNVPFESIEEFRDIDTIVLYQEMLEQNRGTPEELLEFFNRKSRDHARTPMQWTNGENAGFSTETPWIKVNPNYREINAEAALLDPDSIFYFYQKLIHLRHEIELIREGSYKLLEPEREDLFCYQREWKGQKMLVICSFSDQKAAFSLPSEFEKGKILISNCSREKAEASLLLEPWEAMAILI